MANVNVNSAVVLNPDIVEYGKFMEIDNDSRFPAISTLSLHYPDQSQAFPANANVQPLSTITVYPKYAVLNYVINTIGSGGFDYITSSSGTLSAGYNSIFAITNTTISGITANYTTVDNLKNVVIPAGQTIYAPIMYINISAGTAILYKND